MILLLEKIASNTDFAEKSKWTKYLLHVAAPAATFKVNQLEGRQCVNINIPSWIRTWLKKTPTIVVNRDHVFQPFISQFKVSFMHNNVYL
jgi:hypothetical protein